MTCKYIKNIFGFCGALLSYVWLMSISTGERTHVGLQHYNPLNMYVLRLYRIHRLYSKRCDTWLVGQCKCQGSRLAYNAHSTVYRANVLYETNFLMVSFMQSEEERVPCWQLTSSSSYLVIVYTYWNECLKQTLAYLLGRNKIDTYVFFLLKPYFNQPLCR